MPSLKKHGLSAVLLLSIIGLASYTWLNVVAKNQNHEPNLEISLPEAQKPEPAGTDAPLPDLLSEDNIPLDQNPTEALKENLPTPNVQINSALAGQDTQPEPPEAGPKTILIDGNPIGVNAGRVLSVKPLIKAPLPGLSQTSSSGKIPQKGEDGRTVLALYAKSFTPSPSKKYISLVVGGLGINPVITRKAIYELPGEVTLSFAAQAPSLQNWIDQARSRGHEVMLEIPMENANTQAASAANANTNPYILTSDVSGETNIKNLNFLLSRAEGYFALTNYGGEKLVLNEQALKPVVEHINNIGLGFVYDGSTNGARIWHVGRRYNLPIVAADVFIDGSANTRADVRQTIATLAGETDRPVPIGMGFSFGGTVDGISDWLATNPNVDLAPVSYALKRN